MSSAVKIFFSYAYKDETYVQVLRAHLGSLRREGLIEDWAYADLPPGSDWEREIPTQLNTAQIIVLFVSPDFIASDYCYSVEMKYALERHNAGEARVIPVLLRPVLWQNTPLGALTVLPTGEKPISSWTNTDEAFVNVVQGIRKAIQEIRPHSSQPQQLTEITPQQVISNLPKTTRLAISSANFHSLRSTLEQYRKEHTTERLVLQEQGGQVSYYENFVQAVYAWELWHTLIEQVSILENTLQLKLFGELVHLLSSSLFTSRATSISQSASPGFSFTLLNVRELFDNPHIPPDIPVVLYTGSRFNEGNARELRQLVSQILPNSRLALLFLCIDPKNHRDSLRVLRNTLQHVFAYDIIPVISSDFLKIIDAAEPRKVFRRFIFSNVNLKAISPFVTYGPTPPEMFFGREQELRMIHEHVGVSSYALVGGRRIGKTSILRRLAFLTLPEKGFRAIYHDCSLTPTQTEMARAIALEYLDASVQSSSSLSSMANVVQAFPRNKPLVFLLDEVDKLIAHDRTAGYPLFKALRAFANSGRCQFVLCGEYALRRDMQNPHSPLYNFANELLVRRLDYRAARELVLQPLRNLEIDVIDEDRVIQRIWNFTAGHPNVVQRLCHRLVLKVSGSQQFRVGIDDIEEVVEDYDFLRSDFLDTYWEQATSLERLCTLVMVKHAEVHTLSAMYQELVRLIPGLSLDQLKQALERLVYLRNILNHTARGYQFAVTSFPEVVSRTAEIDELIALDCERQRQETEISTERGTS